MQNNDFKDEKDLFIQEKMKKDIFVSKKYDDTFEKIIKGDFKMENKNETNTMPEKSKKGLFKWAVTVAACVLLFGGANIYATTQGYDNIFFMIKNMIAPEESVTVNNKNEILSDRDITISYSNIEIAKGLKMQINKLTIQDNQAKLYIRIDQRESEGTYISKFVVKDITDNKNVQLGMNEETVNKDPITYTECILLSNVTSDVKKLEVELYDENDKKVTTAQIDILNREIILESEENTSSFKKLPETELKEILGLLAHLYKENEEDNLQDKIFEMAVKLVKNTDGEATKENVSKAMEELAGVKLNDNNENGNIAKTIKFDEETQKYVYTSIEIDSPLVFDISELIYNNGIYSATIVYSMPTFEDYEEGRVDQLSKYEMTLQFKLNDEHRYSEYCIINAKELKRKLVSNEKEKEIEQNIETQTNTNILEQTPTPLTTANTNIVEDVKTTDTISNIYTVETDKINWKTGTIDGMTFKYPENWALDEYSYGKEEFPDGSLPRACVSGNVLEHDEKTETNINMWIYESFFVEGLSQDEAYKNIPAGYFASSLPSDTFTSSNGQEWAIIRRDGDAHEYYLHLNQYENGYTVNYISTGYYEGNAEKGKKEILESLDAEDIKECENIDFTESIMGWTEHRAGITVYKYPSNWNTNFTEIEDEIGTRTSMVSGTIKGINHKRNRVVDTKISIKTYRDMLYNGMGENAEFTVLNQYINDIGLISTNHAVASIIDGQQWLRCKKEGNDKAEYYVNVYSYDQAGGHDKPAYITTVVEIYNEDKDNETALEFIENILNNMYMSK